MLIERDADDICLAFLLERAPVRGRLGADWDGEVVSLISSGAFVKFGDEGFEGFLPLRRMRGDWWELNEHETTLVGAESGRAIRLGDPISVEVGERRHAARAGRPGAGAERLAHARSPKPRAVRQPRLDTFIG